MRTVLRTAIATAIVLTAGPLAAAPFDPMRFFDGRTESEGQVKVALHATHALHVHGRGHVEPDGTLVLDQTVDEEGEKPRQRLWRMRQTAPGRYSGTISDAVGPVAAEQNGNRFHLSFQMKGGLSVEEWLTPVGTDTLQNSMTIKKFGFTVATVEETIRQVR